MSRYPHHSQMIDFFARFRSFRYIICRHHPNERGEWEPSGKYVVTDSRNNATAMGVLERMMIGQPRRHSYLLLAPIKFKMRKREENSL